MSMILIVYELRMRYDRLTLRSDKVLAGNAGNIHAGTSICRRWFQCRGVARRFGGSDMFAGKTVIYINGLMLGVLLHIRGRK